MILDLHRLEAAFAFAQRQVRRLGEAHPDYFPMYTVGGRWRHEGETWTNWCEGFLPGMMWIFHEETGDPWWRQQAEHYSRLIEPRKDDRNVHDLGFLFYHGTYRRWYEATVREGRPDPTLREVVFHAGRTLARRFMEKGRYLRSFVAPESLFIDIMMNVPIILYTAIHTGDDALLDLARQHCLTSRRFLVRGDGSTAHEAIFDTATGECLRQSTHQGYRGDSCWARGQAWALYGFATAARLCNDLEMLDTALNCGRYLTAQQQHDPVPPWDFDAPLDLPAQKDSSAAAIAAAGLFELADAIAEPSEVTAEHMNPFTNAFRLLNLDPDLFRPFALRIVAALCEPEYLALDEPAWEGILKHGVYHMHKGLGVNESVMWGDYFFVEALQRALRWLRRPDAS